MKVEVNGVGLSYTECTCAEKDEYSSRDGWRFIYIPATRLFFFFLFFFFIAITISIFLGLSALLRNGSWTGFPGYTLVLSISIHWNVSWIPNPWLSWNHLVLVPGDHQPFAWHGGPACHFASMNSRKDRAALMQGHAASSPVKINNPYIWLVVNKGGWGFFKSIAPSSETIEVECRRNVLYTLKCLRQFVCHLQFISTIHLNAYLHVCRTVSTMAHLRRRI